MYFCSCLYCIYRLYYNVHYDTIHLMLILLYFLFTLLQSPNLYSLPLSLSLLCSQFNNREELIWAIVGSICLPIVFIRDFPVKCSDEVLHCDGLFLVFCCIVLISNVLNDVYCCYVMYENSVAYILYYSSE